MFCIILFSLYSCTDFQSETFVVTFDAKGVTAPEVQYVQRGNKVIKPTAIREGYLLEGWYTSSDNGITFDEEWIFLTKCVTQDITLYANWIKITNGMNLDLTLVSIGEKDKIYTIPLGAQPYSGKTAQVKGGYQMAKTETTYELWYEVRTWAEANGYYFQNKGNEGNDGVAGAPPTDSRLEPVTNVSWHDAIVWCNAYSQYNRLDPVYRTSEGVAVKDSRNAPQVDAVIQTDKNGYRLPTSDEWEMAARWLESWVDSVYGVECEHVKGRIWVIGEYASGVYLSDRNLPYQYGWCADNSNGTTHPVATRKENLLGIYDMSGNVDEWCFDWHPEYIGESRVLRGGSYNNTVRRMQVGDTHAFHPAAIDGSVGFRFVRK